MAKLPPFTPSYYVVVAVQYANRESISKWKADTGKFLRDGEQLYTHLLDRKKGSQFLPWMPSSFHYYHTEAIPLGTQVMIDCSWVEGKL